MNNYNQNENKKTPMVQRYERQIWAAPREGKTISCAESLCVPPETDENKSPLEMHNSYSVFRIAIAQTGVGSVVANIPANDVPYILAEYRFQRDLLRKAQMNYVAKNKETPSSPAYTMPINEKSCQKRTAADIIKDPDGVSKLQNARAYFEKNAAKYPKNREMMNAIDEAMKLYQEGRLEKVQSVYIAPPLYDRQMKHRSTRNAKGYNLIYGITITGSAGKTNEWLFTLNNYYAKLQGTIVQAGTAEDKKVCGMTVTQEEMDSFIYRIESTLRNYESLYFRTQYGIAQKYGQMKREQNKPNRK